MPFESILLPIIFLIGTTCFSALSKAMQITGKIQLKQEFRKKRKLYYFHAITRNVFPKDGWNNVFFLNGSTKQIIRILYATTSIFYLLSQKFFSAAYTYNGHHYTLSIGIFILIILIVVLIGIIFDFLGALFGVTRPLIALKINYPIASIFLIVFCPITFLLLKIQKSILAKNKQSVDFKPKFKIKEKILELVLESELQHELDPQDKRLMISVASFKERIAREIMVPRIDVLSLSCNATVYDAALAFMKDGYSRTPVYKDNVDNIIGVLMYKDVLNFYIEWDQQKKNSPHDITIENLLKPILYTPETKKISTLLQEFRSKQLHLAIVVDEYGGTEGIVTIEDILEEIVGEIADEYDDKTEEQLFSTHADGGWIVDGKMTILDIEKELGLEIPKSPEYDTIGGYIFDRAGAIPTKGWRIHHENFDLEIISSSERSVEKVLVIPAPPEDL